MFLKFLKKFLQFWHYSKKSSVFCVGNKLLLIFLLNNLVISNFYATTILVTNTDSGFSDGSLGAALLGAGDGDTIDCSPIAGQTIYISTPLPAIGHNFASSLASLTILGQGVTLDAGSHSVFSLAQGSATITGFTLQNGLSKGGNGGFGHTGGGGGTGGGGALYVHSGTILTISTLNLTNNQAVGGTGGAGNATGGSGGGGGGFGGGNGGFALATGANAGSGGGGGGNNGGTTGGRDGGVGSPNTFSNFAGAGGGGEIPGINGAKPGGSNASIPAKPGGAGGVGTPTNGAGAGGGGGSATAFPPFPPNNGAGFNGSNAINAASPGTGIGGAGGYGFGADYTYGVGGAGGGGNGGGAGYGASGGGGGLNGPGGAGGSLGGGGGASTSNAGPNHRGGNGGFGAGGGGGNIGGIDTYGLGGAGGSATGTPAGGGGGSGLGGAIFVQKGGLLIVEDGVSFSDNSTTAGQGGTATGGSNGGNGSSLGKDIFIQSGGSVTFQINQDLTMDSPIEGAGLLAEVAGPGVIKSGTGTLQLSGANTYLGGTLIQGGTVNLNGSVSGDVTIESGSTLSGNATVVGSIFNNGTISPGNSIGTIFTTNLTLFPTSVYTVEINAAGDSDLISASGFAQIDGSVVVTPDDFNFTAPQTYTILTTNTGVTGAFSSLTSSTPALMRLIYNPLTVQLTYVPLEALELTCNALNAARCFVTLPTPAGSDTATVNNALLALSFDAMQSAFEQMSPARFSGPTEVQLLDAILVRSTYSKHMQQLYLDKDRACEQPISLWLEGIAQWQKQENPFGYKDTTVGTTMGIDYSNAAWLLGGAFSYTHDRFHATTCTNQARINSYYGGLYGRWNCDAWYVNAALLGAHNNYKTTRSLSFGTTLNRCAHAHHEGREFLINIGSGYHLCWSDIQWTPYFNLDCVFQHEQDYTESGADSLNLHVHPKKSKLFQGELGLACNATYSVCNGKLTPMLTIAYLYQTPFSDHHYCANFVNSSCIFTGKGGDYQRNLFVPRFSLTYQDSCDRVTISLYYDGQVNSTYWAQDVGFDLAFRF